MTHESRLSSKRRNYRPALFPCNPAMLFLRMRGRKKTPMSTTSRLPGLFSIYASFGCGPISESDRSGAMVFASVVERQ